MNRYKQNNITHILNNYQTIVSGLLMVIVMLVGLYLYFVVSTTVNITSRKAIQNDISDAQSRIASLEIEYFSLQEKLSPSVAHEYGLTASASEVFAYRVAPAPTVALNQ